MPDGLRLYPLDGGTLEIMQELLEGANEMDDNDLGNCMVYLYASKYDDVKDLEIEELTEAGNDLVRGITVEDKQAAEEIILADFDALQASVVKSPKGQARTREEQDRLSVPPTSGQDSALDTAETSLKESPQSKSSRLHLQTATQTGTRENPLNGGNQTATKLARSETSLSVSSPQPG